MNEINQKPENRTTQNFIFTLGVVRVSDCN